MAVPTVAVIPVKSFAVGKQRLSEALTPSQRSGLGKAMVEHVAGVVVEAGLIPVLVTADPEVATWAAGQAIPSIPDPDRGLDAAAREGVRWASQCSIRWMILHSDLPLLTAGDLSVFAAAAEGSDAIAPSADGGTSAISAHREIEFAFGPGSFRRHLARLSSPEVVALTGFLHDVDSPSDLLSARRHPRGSWLEPSLR